MDPAAAGVHSVGVGGWVVRADGCVLLVRMTYGPALGRLMLPGGHLDRGETLDQVAVREVLEETGVQAQAHGLLMVRQRALLPLPNLYFVLHMSPVDASDLRPQLAEVSEVLWVPAADLLTRDDVQPIAREVAQAWLAAPATLAPRPLSWTDEAGYALWAG